MPGIVWQNLDPMTMSRLGVDLICEELARRRLDITGSKEELFQSLQADIQQQRDATPSVETNEYASTAAAPLTLDPATLQSFAMLFQQLPRPATTVTTLPDLSSSIPQFAGLHSHSVNTRLDDVRRVQQLTSLDKSAQHLHAKASPSPFAGSVLPPSQPFRATKPAERQQPRSEQSTPQSSQGATPKTHISELPAKQQEATYAAISA
ncbi:hypothetical protein HPB50_001015 [Hyalomma asiaticum]|uniref:Uncharacterized protein n=1 Tax=Hyalomma asiaticum TaxID=266040 RepID=A0ACB7RRL6_HYAAI|nr:hypothetical protein HPB50_001015 [Hyalomma asiaticum]